MPRHEAAVDFTVDGSGCWIWSGSVSTHGYGVLRIRGRQYKAHRVMYEMYRGTIPVGLEIDHLCRVRQCCNPEHLEPVTRAENARRAPSVAKLTPDDVRSIRALHADGVPAPELAEDFGVSKYSVWNILAGRTWVDA